MRAISSLVVAPGRRGEGGGAVAKVVEAEALDADGLGRGEPDTAAEVAAPEKPALGRREHEPLGALLGPGPEVLLERVGDEARHRHRALAGLALGRAVDLGDLPDHGDRPRLASLPAPFPPDSQGVTTP